MFKWLTLRNKEHASSATAAAPLLIKPLTTEVTLAKVKEQLFYEWATEVHGDDEGTKLYQAYLDVLRCSRLISVDGDFVAARHSLLNIAMTFPDVGAMAVGTYESPPKTDGYRRWLARWCEAYPQPIRKPST